MVLRTRFNRLLTAAGIALAGAIAVPAVADIGEARRLLDEGRAGQALRVLEDQLAANPQDAEARFLRGLALSRTRRTDEAIAAFLSLTRDYPQLPEPYNNLAVIYAQQGDYEKARDALESALATHPSYATAHENLGDIYAALASASYNRALMLEDSNGTVRDKLRVMERLGVASTGGGQSAAAQLPTPAATVQRPAVPATDAGAPAAETAAPPVAQTPRRATAAAPTPAPSSTVSERATRERISSAVFDWAQAWQNQNIDAYLASYAPDFQPAGGLSRSAWEAQRRDRVGNPGKITVKVRDPEIQVVNDERARVVFRQEYSSDTYADVTTKTLDLRRVGDRWLILRETTS